MFSYFERTVAFRYLRARRQEGFISVIAGFSFLGITLGVATLVIVMSVMNGFRQELLGRILGLNGHLAVYSTTTYMRDYDGWADRIKRAPGVISVNPMIEKTVMATANGGTTGALVHGMRLDDLKARKLVKDHVIEGSLDQADAPDAAVVGSKFAKKLGLTVGSSMTLVSPDGNSTAFGMMPRMKSFRVAAIFEMGMYEYDNTFVFIPLETAQKFFKTDGQVTGLEIFIDDPEKIHERGEGVYQMLTPDLKLFDWQQANAHFFNVIEVERNVMFVILALMILVAAFNVISSLIMLVKDKARDIAILRTMGASSLSILRIFFLTGAIIGFSGTVAGVVVGVAFSLNIESIRQFLESLLGTKLFQAEIYFLSKLPAKVDPIEVCVVAGVTLGLTFLASLYPAWRASKLDPVEALRYE